MTKTITHAEFVAEIARRKAPKGERTPMTRPEFRTMSGADLADAVELLAAKPARKAPAKKAPAVKAPHVPSADTLARKAAWDWRLAQRKLGRKVSYLDACKAFGTLPAKNA